jgi:hypothetical protein
LSGATAAGLICVKSPLENDEQYGFENDVLVGGEDDGGARLIFRGAVIAAMRS